MADFVFYHFLSLIALFWLIGGIAMDYYETRKGMHL